MVMITNCEEQRKPEIQYNCKMNVTAHNYNGYQFSIQWSRAKGLWCTATHYKGSEIVMDVQYAKPMRQGVTHLSLKAKK